VGHLLLVLHHQLQDTSSKFGVKLVVPDRIQTARKTVYALMGAGLHGMNGINPTFVCGVQLLLVFVQLELVLLLLMYGQEDVEFVLVIVQNMLKDF
jgi:hypothetical protein